MKTVVTNTLVALVVVFVITPASLAQQTADLSKLDPAFHEVVASAGQTTGAGAVSHLRSAVAAGGERVFPAVVRTHEVDRVRAEGIAVSTAIADVVTVRATAAQIARMTLLPEVRYVEAEDTFYPTNDVATALTGAKLLHQGFINNTSYRGSGVIVCIIDTGIDWEHDDFRSLANPAQSRLLGLWDQTLTATGGEQTPAQVHGGGAFSGLTTGVEYTQADIDDEIDGSPAGLVREEDTNGHGTHVAGTAAGNGAASAGQKHAGMAPDADIVVVKAGNGSFPTTNIIDGLSYCGAMADEAGKPVVVNMSLGTDAGPHDGTSATAAAVDGFVDSGKIVVVAAGNSGNENIHISGSLAAGNTASITFDVPTYTADAGDDNDDFGFDLWFDGNGSVTPQVVSPGSNAASTGTTALADGTVSLSTTTAANGDRNVRARVYDGSSSPEPAGGTWTLEMTNTSGGTLDFHGWLYDRRIGSNSQTVSISGGGTIDSGYTLGSPGTATGAITVGSYVHRWRWKDSSDSFWSYGSPDGSDGISGFSSKGPRRDGGVQKPDIAAPGQGMISARSQDATPAGSRLIDSGSYYLTQGTSMASPVVAGAAALLLQAGGGLDESSIRSLMTGNADTDTFTGGAPNDTWGHGRLNVYDAMVDQLGGSPTREMLAYDSWGSTGGLYVSSDDTLSTRFSPGANGKVTGVHFHPANAAVTLAVPLKVEIWSNDPGTGAPLAMLGSSVKYPQDEIMANSWNHVSLVSANVDVVAGTDYHVVIYHETAGGTGQEVTISVDNGSVDGRSYLTSGGAWIASPYGDWRLRPVVATATGVDVLPVELASFEAHEDDGAVALRWETASETNNAGFSIEYAATDESEWSVAGFVEGHGTTVEARQYTYRVENLAPGSYRFRLEQVDLDGATTYSPVVEVAIGMAETFYLAGAYPNPFNSQTAWQLAVAREQQIKIDVYDVLGRRMTQLHDGTVEAGQTQTFTFEADQLPSGLYFIRIDGETFDVTRPVQLVK